MGMAGERATGTVYTSNDMRNTCPHCGAPLRSMPAFVRWWQCRDCLRTYWWDGPSLLGPTDPQRKRGFSDRLQEGTPAERAWVLSL